MKMLFLVVSLFALGFQSSLYAVEPTSELSEKLATRLIGAVSDVLESEIRVASIVEGAKHTKGEFVEGQMRRVTAVHSVIEGARVVRRVHYYDFSWNPRYGWFYQKTGASRNGEEVMIWSEKAGELIVK